MGERKKMGSEEEIRVMIKEEEIPIQISTGVSGPLNNVKSEEEEIPIEIGSGEFSNVAAHRVPLHCVKTEDGVPAEFQDGIRMKVEVKEEADEMKVRCKEEEISMEIGTDGQYMRSVTQDMLEVSGHVLSTPLSREEKLEILKQKLLEKNRLCWVEGGCFPSNPRRDPSNPDHMEDIDTHKIGHTDWCSCGNCIPLPTGRESTCCKEIRTVQPHLEGIPCITRHPYFIYLCENKDFAQIHQNLMYGLHSKGPQDKDKNRALRKAAYQAFSVWIDGALGKKGQRPIPACTVHRVRISFPSPDDTASRTDYPAEHMIFS